LITPLLKPKLFPHVRTFNICHESSIEARPCSPFSPVSLGLCKPPFRLPEKDVSVPTMDCTFQQDEEVELLLAENQALAHKLEELNLQRIC